MQHVTKAATTTATDLGEFTAIAAAYSVDRQGERIAPGAFADTIQRWATSGKTVPLHWNHKAEPDNIIGSINTMKETSEGLLVAGQLDIEESETAREVWRSVKRGRVSLSFGFLVKTAHDEDDIHVLDEVDLFEVSIVATPANEDTRILTTKAMDGEQLDAIAQRFYDLMTAPLVDRSERPAETKATKRHAPITVKTYEVDSC